MKKILALVMALLVVMVCGVATAEQAAPKIGIAIYQFADNFMTLYRTELVRYLTEDCGIPAENITVMDGKNDQAEQTNQIDGFIADNVDVMILNLVQSTSAATVVQKADAAGIPVVFINREPSEEDMKLSDKICYVGADARQSGTFQGEIIAETENHGDFNGNGVVDYVMIMGDPENVDAKYRTEFSIKALEDAGLKTKELYKQRGGHRIGGRKSMIHAVDGVDFEVNSGEVFGIIGESGCGKSTLGRLLVRLEEPTEGDIFFNGESSKALIKKDPKRFHRMVQAVFQNPFDTFTPNDTIAEIMMRPLRLHGIGKNDEERRAMCVKALENGGLMPAEDFLVRFPHELSGGQLQRISILRSMLLEPLFLVADEPVSMLDVSVRAEIIHMFQRLCRTHNTAILFISHDIAIVRYVSQRVAVMYLGRIVEMGDADTVIQHPMHPYTQALISNCSSIDPDADMPVISIEGEPPSPVDPGPGCYFADRCFKACDKCRKSYPPMVTMPDGRQVSCFFAQPIEEEEEHAD